MLLLKPDPYDRARQIIIFFGAASLIMGVVKLFSTNLTMCALILLIMITMGSGEDLKSFETLFNKASRSECLKDAKTHKLLFPFPLISIETRCEPVIGNKPEM